jgi:hypothetical protein
LEFQLQYLETGLLSARQLLEALVTLPVKLVPP